VAHLVRTSSALECVSREMHLRDPNKQCVDLLMVYATLKAGRHLRQNLGSLERGENIYGGERFDEWRRSDTREYCMVVEGFEGWKRDLPHRIEATIGIVFRDPLYSGDELEMKNRLRNHELFTYEEVSGIFTSKFLELVKKFVCVPKRNLHQSGDRMPDVYRALTFCMWADNVKLSRSPNKEVTDWRVDVWEFARNENINSMFEYVDPFINQWLGLA
jgi:hypothetical protein